MLSSTSFPLTKRKENKLQCRYTQGKIHKEKMQGELSISRSQRVPICSKLFVRMSASESAYRAKAAMARAKAITLEAMMLEAAPSYSAPRVLLDWAEPELAAA
jgi:hypothetical protein